MPSAIQITQGLFSHMVLQRDAKNVSCANIAGTTSVTGPVVATVRRGKRALPGLASKTIGVAKNGKFSATLSGIPVGGPYTVEIAIAGERLTVADLLVGDVWLLAGQSNMQGCGHITPESKLRADPQVRAFYMDDQWRIARDPLHNMWLAVDAIHADLNGGHPPPQPPAWFGVCPGPAFAQAMYQSTGMPQGLIAAAHGGTSMSQWDPARKSEGGKSLYGASIRRVTKNGGRIAGILWYQGESDTDPNNHRQYTARMKTLIASFRRDCGDKNLPFAMVQISRVIGQGPAAGKFWDSIRDQQYKLQRLIPNVSVVPTIDLALDDFVHISGVEQNRLGRRLAAAMQVVKQGRRAGLPQIEFAGAKFELLRGAAVIVVDFKNVAGSLHAAGRAAGFSVVSSGNMDNLFAVDVKGSRAYLRVNVMPDRLWDAVLYYGRGTDPVCNITDKADRSIPSFGPLPLGKPRAITPFITTISVSPFLPATDEWKSLAIPGPEELRQFAERRFPTNFCSLREEIVRRGTENNTVYYARRFECGEPMKLAVHLGYDGPLKVWIDGKELVCDPTGTNPAMQSELIRKFSVDKGAHELVVALGTASGKAWGVFLQLERTDVPARLIAEGGEAYQMPVLR